MANRKALTLKGGSAEIQASGCRHSRLAAAMLIIAIGWLLISTASPGFAAAKCEFSGPFSNGPGLEYPAVSATKVAPQEVVLRGDGPLVLSLQRTLMTFPGETKAEIASSTSDDAPFEPVCETDWISTAKVITMRTPAVSSGVRLWRIRIFDSVGGGPTGEFPYLIDVSVAAPRGPSTSLVAVSNVPSNKSFSGIASQPTSACDNGPLVTDRNFVPVRTTENSVVGPGAPWIWHTAASRHLQLQLSADHAARVRVRLFAKEPAGLAFEGVCESTIALGTDGLTSIVVGRANWPRLTFPIWRVEIEPLLGDDGKFRPLTLKASASTEGAAPPPVRTDLADAAAEKLDWRFAGAAFQCRSWLPRSATRPNMGQRFPAAAQPPSLTTAPQNGAALPAGVAVKLGSGLSVHATAILGRALRMAMGLWAANCGKCRYDALSVIQIGDDAWVREDIVRPLLPRAPNIARMFPSTMYGDLLLQRTATTVGGNELFGERPITPSDRSAICARDPSGLQAAAYNAITAMLGCNGSPTASSQTTVTLLVDKEQPTACGSTSNIIACEEDTSYVELNGRDYKFCLTSEDGECLGDGDRRVDLVQIMLHEVGHWIGLEHSNLPESIMAPSMGRSRCITNDDVDHLAQVVSRSERASVGGVPKAFRMVDDSEN